MNTNAWSKIVCANWKMNMNCAEGADLARGLATLAEKTKNVGVWIAPPFLTIGAVKEALKDTAVKVGAQNVHWEGSGAFTGEVSCPMLLEQGVEFVIIGHSERRHIFGETDQMIAKKLRSSLTNNFYSILCVGETDIERKKGATNEVIARQLEAALHGLGEEKLQRLVIAYEPVWAIGTGNVASNEQIQSVHEFIRQKLDLLAGSLTPPILYGGSVAPDNFDSIIKINEVHGALVGGASLVLEKFAKLVEIAEA